MPEDCKNILKRKLSDESYRKLAALENHRLHRFVAEAVELCNPEHILVVTDSAEDIAGVRRLAIELGEEQHLGIDGHTVHFDAYRDQARDKPNTKYLVPPGKDLGANLNATDKEAGLDEVKGFLKAAMAGKTAFLRFFCLGPTNSPFSISGVQLTDSAYVAHSEDLLYRSGYQQFKRLGDSSDFFRILHSAGELENHVSKNVDKRRVYIDLDDECVYSVNTQYAGNTIGFKKLSLRLAIRKADHEGWLAEHMFVLGVHGPNHRVTYFTGAYPSFCGKTSTAMLPGETIVGDDIAYLRAIDGEARAVNVESGIFGIIRNVNPEDDPAICGILNNPGEVIFSNVLINDGTPYWLGMGRKLPADGVNHSGNWHAGKKDTDGNEVTASHKNARYTVAMAALPTLASRANDPAGVPVSAVIYGGRDSDTWVPVQQSFDWAHGAVTMGASLESESTAAPLGEEGVRKSQPLANLDFVSIPLGKYLQNHLDFAQRLARLPVIFATNYFLKDEDGEYLNGMADKQVWVKWMELRVHGDLRAIRTPTGHIPRYEHLGPLFGEVLGKNYAEADYERQFTLRIPENLAKIDRIEEIYRTQVAGTPEVLFDILGAQRQRLTAAREKHGEYISPLTFAQDAPP